jgi:PAS domain S-box-containing protein
VAMQPPEFGEASRRSETLLRESEERFRLLVESVKDYAIFMLDPEGRITTWNRGAQRIKGYGPEEIIGEHFSIFYTEEDVERGHPAHELRLAAAEGSYEEEGLRVRKDGSTFWASVVITALRDEEGDLQGFAKVTRDITARKETEERELLLAREQAAREKATDILESISDASFAVDVDWRFTYVNSVAEELWGRPREELLGKNLWEEFPQAAGSEYYRRLKRAMEEGVTTEFETLSSDLGAWVAGRAYPSQEGLSVFFRDVTDSKRAEEERARLAAIVESSDDVIIGKTLDGVITSWNRGAEKIYGYSAAEAVGQPVSMLVPPERPNEIPSIFGTIRRGEKVDHFETERVAKDGRRLNISLSVSPIRNAAGDIVGAATIARDITERKRAEEAVRQAREAERLRVARDLHDDVLQDLSYTAAAMGMMIFKAEGTDLAEDLQKAIDAVRRAAQGLRRAVSDLRLDEEDRPFHELVGSLVHRARSMDPDRDLRLEVKAGFPSRSLGAAGVEISRVIQEALTNARRHSGARNVSVSLAVDGEALVAEVADDGRGFDPEAPPGTGLRGMRERVLRLGGDLRVESAPGEGTRVRVRVPMRAAPQDASGSEARVYGEGR